MKMIVTGGAGYIGSHIIVELLNEGHDILAIDNFSTSSPKVFDRIKKITGIDVPYKNVDIKNYNKIKNIFLDFAPNLIIHLAGLKSVNESKNDPLLYYENNVFGSINILKAMDEIECKKIIFSSSATVYGIPNYLPYDEKHYCYPINPYGESKLAVEKIIADWVQSNNKNRSVILRYFNPIGAHPSGLIGEQPTGIPNNLMPFITQHAIGKLDRLHIFGKDYNTIDGTGVRDYIHVVDLAKGHISALNYIENLPNFEIFNLGAGKGFSVLQVIKSFEKMTGISINYNFAPRRDGDIDEYFTDVKKSKDLLNWETQLSLDEMTKDSWNWQSKNPNGYK